MQGMERLRRSAGPVREEGQEPLDRGRAGQAVVRLGRAAGDLRVVGSAHEHPHRALAQRRERVLVRRSEEHTSELQSQSNLVCRLLLEKKKKNKTTHCCCVIMNDISVLY